MSSRVSPTLRQLYKTRDAIEARLALPMTSEEEAGWRRQLDDVRARISRLDQPRSGLERFRARYQR